MVRAFPFSPAHDAFPFQCAELAGDHCRLALSTASVVIEDDPISGFAKFVRASRVREQSRVVSHRLLEPCYPP